MVLDPVMPPAPPIAPRGFTGPKLKQVMSASVPTFLFLYDAPADGAASSIVVRLCFFAMATILSTSGVCPLMSIHRMTLVLSVICASILSSSMQ